MRFTDVEKAVRILSPMLSESRRQRISNVVANRTSSVAVLLENVWDMGNRNAVMRSMDAFGVHTLHTLTHGEEKKLTHGEKSHRGKKSEMRTDAGALNWLVRRGWSEVDTCVRQLREAGYSLASTAPDAEMKLEDIDFTQKVVVAFGNEQTGLSPALLESSDVQFSIPMVGFVESLNLSVSVAVTLHQAHTQRLAKLGHSGDLPEQEKLELTLQYYMNSLDAKIAHTILNRIQLTQHRNKISHGNNTIYV